MKLLSISTVVSLTPLSRGINTDTIVGTFVVILVLLVDTGSSILIPDTAVGIALCELLSVAFVVFGGTNVGIIGIVGETVVRFNTVGRMNIGVLVTFGGMVVGGISYF